MLVAFIIASGIAYGAVDPILIGEYGSLTGSEATFGQTTHRGIVLAVEQANAAGGVNGRPVEVRVYDDQGKSQEVGTAVTRLITNDHVVALLGEVASSLSIAGARVAQQYGVPMISPSSTAGEVTKTGDMIARACFVSAFQGYAAARWARDNLGLSRAAILYDQAQTYSKDLGVIFKKAFEEMGGVIVTEQAYSGGDQDYSAQLTSIKAAGPQIIYAPGYYTDIGNVHLQARKLGLRQPFIGGDGWDSPELVAIAGETAEGSFYTSQYANEDERPEVQELIVAWKARYNAVPDGLGALGYDAARILIDAMRRAPSLAPKDLAGRHCCDARLPGRDRPHHDGCESQSGEGRHHHRGEKRAAGLRRHGSAARSERAFRGKGELRRQPAPVSATTGMSRFLQTLLDAIAVGALYALIALGYTMVYGILQFINFAHSDVFMSGAWVALGDRFSVLGKFRSRALGGADCLRRSRLRHREVCLPATALGAALECVDHGDRRVAAHSEHWATAQCLWHRATPHAAGDR